MGKKAKNTATTRRLGTQQQDRLLPALLPSSVQIDEKTLSQNLDFTYRLAALFKLFDQNNSVFGNWQWMLQNDSVFTLGSIGATVLDAIPKAAARTIRRYEKALDLGTKAEAISQLFLYTDQLASNLADWVARFDLIENDRLDLLGTISEILRTNIGTLIGSWQACLSGLTNLLPESPSVIVGRNFYGDVATIMQILGPILDLPKTEIDPGFTDLNSYFNYLKDLYQNLYRSNVQVKAAMVPFLEKAMNEANHEPHNTLLLAFQKLMEPAISSLNTLTERHLDYYYREVLRLSKQQPIPDEVFLQFKLKKGQTSAVVPAQTPMLAGKGSEGENLLYLTEKTLFVNLVTIAETLTVTNTGAQAAIVGDGQLLSNAKASAKAPWLPFGGLKAPNTTAAAIGFAIADPVLFLSMGERKIILIFSIQDTALEALEQALQVFDPSQSLSALFSSILGKAFLLSFTGPKGWVNADLDQDLQLISKEFPAPQGLNIPAGTQGFYLEASISADLPALVEYDEKLHGLGYKTGAPLLRLLLDTTFASGQTVVKKNSSQNVKVYPYNLLRNLLVESIEIQVSVKGKTDFALQNDASAINPKKAFQALGPAPEQGASLYIGSPEVFRKDLSSLSLTLDWTKLPIDPLGFAGYYSIWNEVLTSPEIHNDSFRVAFSILQKRNWIPIKPISSSSETTETDFLLFDWETNSTPAKPNEKVAFSPEFWLKENIAVDGTWIEAALAGDNPRDGKLKAQSLWDNLDLSAIDPASITQVPAQSLPDNFSYNSDQVTGFLRLSLSAPEHGFGATLFAAANHEVNSFNTTSILDAALSANKDAKPVILAAPAPPFVPQAKGLSIDYTAKTTISATQKNVGTCYWVQPFGILEVAIGAANAQNNALPFTILPNYEDEGYLYLGLQNVNVPETLTIYVEVDENSASTEIMAAPKIEWSYLSNGNWQAFKTTEVLSDGTKNFSQSGIVELMLNVMPSVDNAWFNSLKNDAELAWIRATVAQSIAATCNVRLMSTQAVAAKYQIGPSANSHLATALPAATIKNFLQPIPEIGSVTQAFESFNGRVGEDDAAYYIRIHERLRHKSRSITQWDIERLLLENFPEIGVANCFNHCSTTTSMHPGQVLVIVFPAGSSSSQNNPFNPKFPRSHLQRFQSFLQNLAPASMEIVVSNPSYESLLVQAKVTFMPELDPGFYLQKLNDDICGFLAPWSQTTAAAESINPFASLLSQALIMGFINGRDYIQSLESLDVYQFWTQNGEAKSAMQKGEYDYFDVHQAWHILTTVIEHQLFDADSPASTQAIPLGKVIAASNVEGLPGIGEMGIVPHKIGKVELGQIEYLSIESNN